MVALLAAMFVSFNISLNLVYLKALKLLKVAGELLRWLPRWNLAPFLM